MAGYRGGWREESGAGGEGGWEVRGRLYSWLGPFGLAMRPRNVSRRPKHA